MSHASCYYRSLVTSPGGTWQLLYTCHSKHVISYKLWVPGCVTVHALAIKTDVKPTRVIITTMIMYNNRSVSRRQHQEGCIRSHFRDQLFVVMPVLLLPLMHTRRQPGPRQRIFPRVLNVKKTESSPWILAVISGFLLTAVCYKLEKKTSSWRPWP